MMKEQDLQN